MACKKASTSYKLLIYKPRNTIYREILEKNHNFINFPNYSALCLKVSMPSSESASLVLAKPAIHMRSSELFLVGVIHTLPPIFFCIKCYWNWALLHLCSTWGHSVTELRSCYGNQVALKAWPICCLFTETPCWPCSIRSCAHDNLGDLSGVGVRTDSPSGPYWKYPWYFCSIRRFEAG